MVKIDNVESVVCKYGATGVGSVQCLKAGCPEQTCGQVEEPEPQCELTESTDQSKCLVSAANLVW